MGLNARPLAVAHRLLPLRPGEVAERLKAALLKSAESQDFVGSNPTLSAKRDRRLDVDGGVAALHSSLTHSQVRSLGSSGRRLALAAQPPVAR